MAARAWAAATLDSRGPVHLNLPFREPLLDAGFPEPVSEPGDAGVRVSGASKRLAPEQVRELAGRLRSAERGVIVASGRPAPAPAVARLAAALGWPVLADATSALRWGDHDRSHVVCGADILLRDDVLARAWRPDALLRLGTAAASKPLVRFLAGAQAPLDVLVAAEDWPDAEFGASMIVRAEAGALCHDLADVLQAAAPSDWLRGWLESDAGVLGAIDRAEREQREAPTLEEPLVARLALASVAGCLAAGDEGLLVVGNSMPIRDLESFGGGGPQRVRVLANRGANGIDGVVSTALGAAVAHGGAAVAVLGDLSFLHDIGALVTARAVGANLVVVVVDNDGGGIFRMLPQAAMRTGFDELLRTPQGIAADRAAAGLAASAVTVSSAALLESAIGRGLAAGGVHVVRVATDSARAVEIRRGLAASALEQRRIERSRCDADGSGAGAGQ
jgi:2-succinyl-5-enolpyruvyl-6-hydroxy-3-cyclohexene-1-carboxylate synthase